MIVLRLSGCATRTLTRDLMARWQRSPYSRDLIRRELIDQLPFWRGLVVLATFTLAPRLRGQELLPWTTGDVLDEYARRRRTGTL